MIRPWTTRVREPVPPHGSLPSNDFLGFGDLLVDAAQGPLGPDDPVLAIDDQVTSPMDWSPGNP